MALSDLTPLASGTTAVITGGASGIGLAVARQLAGAGMQLVLADRNEDALTAARAELGDGPDLITHALDVSDAGAMDALAARVAADCGPVTFLMNNAGAGMNPGKPWENGDKWRDLLAINLGGVINGVQAFVPHMLEHGQAGFVVNTGSKQGITLPPGNSAYNVSKAGVKAFTEMLAHELRSLEGGALSAHLLVPGFTYTGMISQFLPEKPPAAWTSDQVADFLFDALGRDEFYILCPDNDVDRQTDEKRIAWTAGDMIDNRPPLSRWHKDYAAAFEAFMASGS
ncbi:SDR family NAD(P)-dependent oxidoreductase [Pyruvatibacter mobilis]|uniref:SDR family NAD(P)-dependent oxidoreductase n=1 Tax=Pyruvatibacter mobilis TaxID=1712261 RepID=UPI003BA9B89E